MCLSSISWATMVLLLFVPENHLSLRSSASTGLVFGFWAKNLHVDALGAERNFNFDFYRSTFQTLQIQQLRLLRKDDLH